jgi:hypothetical protein
MKAMRRIRYEPRWLMVPLILCLLAVLSGCLWPLHGMGDQWTVISGVVVEGNTSTITPLIGKLQEQPDGLEGATVEMWIDGRDEVHPSTTGTSGRGGIFVIQTNGYHKTVTLKVHKDGYVPIEKKVQVEWGESAQVKVTLQRRPA